MASPYDRRRHGATAFAEVDRRYGGFDRYRKDELKVDDAALARLKDKFRKGSPNRS